MKKPQALSYPPWLIGGRLAERNEHYYVTCLICEKSGGIVNKSRNIIARFLKNHKRCGELIRIK